MLCFVQPSSNLALARVGHAQARAFAAINVVGYAYRFCRRIAYFDMAWADVVNSACVGTQLELLHLVMQSKSLRCKFARLIAAIQVNVQNSALGSRAKPDC